MKSHLKLMACTAFMLAASCVTFAQDEAPAQRIEKATTCPSLECYAPSVTVQLVCNEVPSFSVMLLTTPLTLQPNDNGCIASLPAGAPRPVDSRNKCSDRYLRQEIKALSKANIRLQCSADYWLQVARSRC